MYASFSAVDDQDVEGGYYLWRKKELSRVLTDTEGEVMELAWSLRGPLKFAAGYLPRKGLLPIDISTSLKIAEPEVISTIESARNKLYRARSARVLPVDTKLLAGWNGLALAAYAEAAIVTKNDGFLKSARRIRDYIMSELWDGSALRRAVYGDRILGKASLEDYAFVSRGLWMWARLSQDPVDFAVVQSIVEQAWARFYEDGWRMAETSFIAVEPVRDLIADGPMPSPAAVVAQVSLDVAEKSANEPLRKRALAALNSGGRQLDGKWFWHVSHIQALLAANRMESTVAHSL
jgi:hypothetical protein